MQVTHRTSIYVIVSSEDWTSEIPEHLKSGHLVHCKIFEWQLSTYFHVTWSTLLNLELWVCILDSIQNQKKFGFQMIEWLFWPSKIWTNRGSDNHMQTSALRQPEKDLHWRLRQSRFGCQCLNGQCLNIWYLNRRFYEFWYICTTTAIKNDFVISVFFLIIRPFGKNILEYSPYLVFIYLAFWFRP